MHGDDVASASVSVATETVSKATEILLEILKVAIERERNTKEKSKVLSGGEVAYQKLKDGGEVTMLPSFAKEDYGEFLKKAKKMGVPVAAVQETGRENTLSLFFNVKDQDAVNKIVQDIVREKLKQPEQNERMITIEKEDAEAFQLACAKQDIPVNFMESKDDVKCIFNSAYEQQVQAVVTDFRKIQTELSKTSVSVEKDKRGRPKIIIQDSESGKKLSMNFCTKAKVERVLQEQLGYSESKAVQAANALTAKLSEQQKDYYLSGSRTLERMEYYQKNIQLENENILTEPYSFAKMKFQNEDAPRLTITDSQGNFVVLSGNSLDREKAEKDIRQYLKLENPEIIKAVMTKAERLGFLETPKQVQYKEYQIERDTQSTFTVRAGSTEIRLNLDNKDAARKQLMDSFGMSAAKADRIISKAQKQSLTSNLLRKAKEKAEKAENTLKHKKRERGSRK